MTTRVPTRVLTLACGMAMVWTQLLATSSEARAQQPTLEPAPAPPAAPMPAEPVPMMPPGDMSGSAPVVAAPPAPAAPMGNTDHDSVVGSWGIEVRRVATVSRTLGQELECFDACPFDLNALSVRRWSNPNYAWNAGLIAGVGGGSSRIMGDTRTWDTYLAVGTTLGSSHLLTNWKHLAISLSPQLDLIWWMPSGKGSKTLMANLRGVVEGEVHLGMIGLPAASVALSSGLAVNFAYITEDEKDTAVVAGATATRWNLGITGPQSLWDLVTKMTLRYYF